jgi:uncharacterized protein
MKIEDLIWLDEIVEKIQNKHKVSQVEVVQTFNHQPRFRYITKGRRQKNEDVYAAYGQTEAGPYLTVFFIHKPGNLALSISARDMDGKERKQYGRNERT